MHFFFPFSYFITFFFFPLSKGAARDGKKNTKKKNVKGAMHPAHLSSLVLSVSPFFITIKRERENEKEGPTAAGRDEKTR